MSDNSIPSIPKEPLVEALVAEWAATDELLSGLPDPAWSTPSALPGWTVHDIVAHVVGTESMLAGEQAPDAVPDVTALPHVRNEIGAANENWVQASRGESPREALARLRAVTDNRAQVLTTMTQDEFDAPSWTPIGQSTYGRFMQIRLFDCWMHEQDIRDAVGVPGHEDGPCAEGSLDEVVRALGFIVGKRGRAPDGGAVSIDLTGPVHRTIHVVVDGRARVVPALDRPPTSTLRLSSALFMRLAGGRVDPGRHLHEISRDGDLELAERVAHNLPFTI
jgi:uncharacterized protein (TIGR03083 family)